MAKPSWLCRCLPCCEFSPSSLGKGRCRVRRGCGATTFDWKHPASHPPPRTPPLGTQRLCPIYAALVGDDGNVSSRHFWANELNPRSSFEVFCALDLSRKKQSWPLMLTQDETRPIIREVCPPKVMNPH